MLEQTTWGRKNAVGDSFTGGWKKVGEASNVLNVSDSPPVGSLSS